MSEEEFERQTKKKSVPASFLHEKVKGQMLLYLLPGLWPVSAALQSYFSAPHTQISHL